jgi:guanylate kinase
VQLLIVISGPSGAGKGTICRELLRLDQSLALSVSATTRKQRPGEVYGREYFFCDDAEFQRVVAREGFLEWAEVHGRRYGTLKEKVDEIIKSGKDCILEIDVQGGLQVYREMKSKCLTIFINAPSEEELIRRISNRNPEKLEEIKRRMLTAQWEITQQDKYQYTVINNDLNMAVKEILDIIKEERKERASAIN